LLDGKQCEFGMFIFKVQLNVGPLSQVQHLGSVYWGKHVAQVEG